MTEPYDVAVVGGGVAGLTLAFELGRRGARAVVLDAGDGLRGASTVPTALLNPHRGRTARARPGDLAGLAATWRLVSELESRGLNHGARRTGVLRVASSARQAGLWREVAEAHPGTRWLESHEVASPVHAPHGALQVIGGGVIETARFLAALAVAAASEGAALVARTRVTSVSAPGGGLVLEAQLEQERSPAASPLCMASRDMSGIVRFEARHLVLCTGATPAPPGCRLPHLTAAGGVAAVLRPPPGGLSGLGSLPPLAGAVNAAFSPDRVVVTGGSLPPLLPTSDALRESALGLRDALAWSVPAVADAVLETAWFGVRARRRSGTPVVRRLAPRVTFYGGLAGRGYLCAADLSARLAERLVALLGS